MVAQKLDVVATFICDYYGGSYEDLYLLSDTCHNYEFKADDNETYVWIVRGNKDVKYFKEGAKYRIIGNIHGRLPDNRGIKVTHLKVTQV